MNSSVAKCALWKPRTSNREGPDDTGHNLGGGVRENTALSRETEDWSVRPTRKKPSGRCAGRRRPTAVTQRETDADAQMTENPQRTATREEHGSTKSDGEDALCESESGERTRATKPKRAKSE